MNYSVVNISTSLSISDNLLKIPNTNFIQKMCNKAEIASKQNSEAITRSMEMSADDAISGLNTKGLKIAHLNINSLRNKLSELALIMHKFQITVMVVSETKLNRSDLTSRLMVKQFSTAMDTQRGSQSYMEKRRGRREIEMRQLAVVM